jgi:hypothetical protein
MFEHTSLLLYVASFSVSFEFLFGGSEPGFVCLIGLILLVFHFFIVTFFFLSMVMSMVPVIVWIDYIKHKIVRENLMQPLGVEWSSSFVKETGDTILLRLRIYIVPVLLQPFAISLSLLEVKLACINDFRKVNLGFDSLDDLSLLIELFDRVFYFFLFFVGNQVALVQKDYVCELNLVTHQLED